MLSLQLMLKGLILGSSGTCPTKDRNCTSIFLNLGAETALLDCAEGTQRQMLKYQESLMVDWIFISHYHLDHYIGIIGLIGTMNLLNRTVPLDVYSPDSERLKTLFANTLKAIKFKLNLITIIPQIEYIRKDCRLTFKKVDHLILSYAIVIHALKNIKYKKELGQLPAEHLKAVLNEDSSAAGFDIESYIESRLPFYELVYSGDTRPLASLFECVKNGVILHECSFFRKDQLGIAKSKYHTHFDQICNVNTGQNHLVLIHLPTKDLHAILSKTVQKVNKNIKLGFDGLRFSLIRGAIKWQ